MGATWDGGLAWLAAALALNSVVSLFDDLRWIRAALRPAAQLGEAVETGGSGPGAGAAAVVAASATIMMGLAAGPLWHVLS